MAELLVSHGFIETARNQVTRRNMHSVPTPTTGIPNMGFSLVISACPPEIRHPYEFRTCGRYTPLTLCV